MRETEEGWVWDLAGSGRNVLAMFLCCETLERHREADHACLGGKLRPLEACTFSSSLSWQVQVRSHPPSRCKLIFSFRDNPYFLNSVIIKEYYLDITGKRWLPG